MADHYDLYDLEGQIEPALKGSLVARLQAAAITCQVLTTREKDIKSTPRIEVSMSLNAALSQRTAAGQTGPNKKQVPNAFEVIITLTVVTTRPIAQDNADKHGRLVGLCRYTMTAPARPFTDVNLPLLQVLDVLPSNQSPRVYDGKSQDISQLSYAAQIAIRNEAWPVDPG